MDKFVELIMKENQVLEKINANIDQVKAEIENETIKKKQKEEQSGELEEKIKVNGERIDLLKSLKGKSIFGYCLKNTPKKLLERVLPGLKEDGCLKIAVLLVMLIGFNLFLGIPSGLIVFLSSCCFLMIVFLINTTLKLFLNIKSLKKNNDLDGLVEENEDLFNKLNKLVLEKNNIKIIIDELSKELTLLENQKEQVQGDKEMVEGLRIKSIEALVTKAALNQEFGKFSSLDLEKVIKRVREHMEVK